MPGSYEPALAYRCFSAPFVIAFPCVYVLAFFDRSRCHPGLHCCLQHIRLSAPCRRKRSMSSPLEVITSAIESFYSLWPHGLKGHCDPRHHLNGHTVLQIWLELH